MQKDFTYELAFFLKFTSLHAYLNNKRILR